VTEPLTIIHRIQNAVTKIGFSNGTKIPEPEYKGEDKSNSARETWFNRWTVAAEYLVASNISKIAEKRIETAKAKLTQAFAPDIAKLKAGDKSLLQCGNVGLLLNLRNGARRINRATVISVLTTEYKWKLEDINKFMDKIEVAGNPALYITTSTTVE
jgi:hypothetical protein